MEDEMQVVAEEKLEATAEPKESEAKKYTDKEVDELIARKYAKWKADQEAKEDEAKRLAKMNADEKRTYETEQLKAQIAALEKERTMTQMKETARGMLLEAKIQAPDELLSVLVTDDAESTKKAVEAFTGLVAKVVEAEVNERLKGRTPKAGTGQTASLTKEQILAVKDRAERLKLIEQNMGLFS